MPVPTAAQRVANLPTGQAVTELLALDEAGAASIINRCDDLDGGRLLSAIAAKDSVRARKILDMVTTDRAGQFLDQMSPVAAAAALSRPPAAGAAGILEGADTPTVVEALTEMSPGSAASVVLEMHDGRAVEVLDAAAVRTAANILLRLPAARRQVLLDGLSSAFRAAVIRHL
jgi:Mg/Co/Ni transporter MgtE